MRDFDKYEENGAYHWDWYDDPNYAWYKECVDRCVNFCQGSTLDVGCGDGLVSKLISDKGHDVYGIDNDNTGLELAADRVPNAQFRLMDIKPMVGAGTEWEYMVCLNTIEHMESPAPLLEMLELNVTKGAIIITDKATDKPGRYHEHEYTLPKLMELFREFKPLPFKIESTEFGKPISFIGIEIRK